MKAEYLMDGVKLEHVNEEKDLVIIVWVIISEDLKWEKQRSSAVSKANRILGMINRNFVDRAKETILLLYKSLVRPHLEYCCQVWSPHYSKDIKLINNNNNNIRIYIAPWVVTSEALEGWGDLIEGVQRRATKLINGMENCTMRKDSDTWGWWVWKHVGLEVIWLRYSSF